MSAASSRVTRVAVLEDHGVVDGPDRAALVQDADLGLEVEVDVLVRSVLPAAEQALGLLRGGPATTRTCWCRPSSRGFRLSAVIGISCTLPSETLPLRAAGLSAVKRNTMHLGRVAGEVLARVVHAAGRVGDRLDGAADVQFAAVVAELRVRQSRRRRRRRAGSRRCSPRCRPTASPR